MKFFDISPRNREDIADLKQENKLTLICIFLSWMIVSTAGIRFYWTENVAENNTLDAILFFSCMFFPWLISVSVYKRRPASPKLRKHMYYTVLLFFLFVVFSHKPPKFVLIILPIMMSTIAYCDIQMTFRFDLAVVLIYFSGLISELIGRREEQDYNLKIYVLFILIGTAMFLLLCSRLIEVKAQKKNAAVNKERDRFQAIVSVGITRVFEYDIANDMIMSAESSGGAYGKEQYICNFSSVAKGQKYVPFSDWYKLDEILVECKSGVTIIDKEIRIRDEVTNDFRWYRIKARVMFNDEGREDKLIGTLEDIEDAKRLEFRLADEKMRDPVTKLYKRNFFIQFVDEYLGKENNNPGAFLILDIDDYKKINEEMGTVFGDEILKNIAEDIQHLFFDTDILGRSGSDEFVILMKNIEDVKDVEKKVKEIQGIIAETYIGEGIRRNCTVSIGVALFPQHGDRYNQLLECADKALMLAKSKGPNHYDVYNDAKVEVYRLLTAEIAKKNNMRDSEKERDYGSETFIELAFRLIDESKDTDSAINLLMRQVIRQMNIGGIVVTTKEKDRKAMKVMYCCGLESLGTENLYMIEYSDEQWEDTVQLYDVDGVAICNSINDPKSEYIRQYMMAYGIEAFVGCAFFERGEFAGAIDFLDFESEHDWTDEEIKNIKSLTNVISSYLLKMKAYEDASETVERLTGYDPVTGLYKYEKFLKLTRDYIENAEHGNYAMVYLDICHFKYLNDTYGYETGDSILHELAEFILSKPEYVVMASRVFSDNVVVLIKLDDMSIEALKNGITHVTSDFSDRVKQKLSDSLMDLRVGICTFSISGGPVMIQNIISNANMARKRTKLPMMPKIIIYDEQMGHAAKNEIAYANDMEKALQNKEFVVYMQPKVNLKTNMVEGAEALVRWRKEDGSIIYPNDFIPVFERNRSITLLDFYVYEEVCKYIRKRLDANLPIVRISINVSRVHLYAIDAIIDKVSSLIKEYDVPPKYLEFELTETSFTDKVNDTVTLMSRLRGLGVKVSMDDFGSGYSSLNVLTRLPLDVLKIDKEFLKDFETDSEEKVVIPSVIAMAKKLNLEVVCEGVETVEQVEFLRSIDCDFAQGYYYAKPIPQQEFDEMLGA